MFLILCTILVCFGVSTTTPLNDSGMVIKNVTGQCSCNDDIQQLYMELKETQNRIVTLENSLLVKNGTQFPVNMEASDIYPDVIGFTVALYNSVSDLPEGSTVLYDSIYYNAGNGYNPSTGEFICPRTGMYLFSIYVSSLTATVANIHLKINGQPSISAVSEPMRDDQDSTGGNTLIQHIQLGDRVWVETQDVNDQDLYKHFTSFSGVLIQST